VAKKFFKHRRDGTASRSKSRRQSSTSRVKMAGLTRLGATLGRRVAAPARYASSLNVSLEESDPEIFNLIEHEKRRQRDGLVLIASENFTSKAVFDALGSVMSNK
jgi:glycine hydroxymethyltransferase